MMMSPFSLILAVALAQAAPRPEPARPTLAQLLPESTIAFFGVDDVDRWRTEMLESRWGKLLQDAAFKPTVDDVKRRWTELVQDDVKQGGIDPAALLEHLHGACGLALFEVRPRPRALESADAKAAGFPLTMGVLCDLREGAEAFAALIEREIDRSVEKSHATRKVDDLGEGLVVVTLESKGESQAPMRLRYAFLKSYFLLVVDGGGGGRRDYLLDTADLIQQRKVDVTALQSSESFARLSRKLGEDGGITCFLSVRGLLDAALSAGAEESVRKAGLGDLGRFLLRSQMRSDGARSAAFLEIKGEGLLSRAVHCLAPCDVGMARLAGQDVLQFLALGLDLPKLLALLRDTAAQALDEGADSLGSDWQQGLTAALSGQLALMIDAPAAESAPAGGFDEKAFAICVGVKDATRLEAMLDGFKRSHGWHAIEKQEDYLGSTIRCLPLITPIYTCLSGGYLLLAMNGEPIRAMVRRLAHPDQYPSLAKLGGLGAPSKEAGAPPVLLMSSDSARSAKAILQGFARMNQAIAAHAGDGPAGAAADAGLPLPDAAVVDRYMSGRTLFCVTLDEDGARLVATDRR